MGRADRGNAGVGCLPWELTRGSLAFHFIHGEFQRCKAVGMWVASSDNVPAYQNTAVHLGDGIKDVCVSSGWLVIELVSCGTAASGQERGKGRHAGAGLPATLAAREDGGGQEEIEHGTCMEREEVLAKEFKIRNGGESGRALGQCIRRVSQEICTFTALLFPPRLDVTPHALVPISYTPHSTGNQNL